MDDDSAHIQTPTPAHTGLGRFDRLQLCSQTLTGDTLWSSPSPKALATPHPTLILQCLIAL